MANKSGQTAPPVELGTGCEAGGPVAGLAAHVLVGQLRAERVVVEPRAAARLTAPLLPLGAAEKRAVDAGDVAGASFVADRAVRAVALDDVATLGEDVLAQRPALASDALWWGKGGGT